MNRFTEFDRASGRITRRGICGNIPIVRNDRAYIMSNVDRCCNFIEHDGIDKEGRAINPRGITKKVTESLSPRRIIQREETEEDSIVLKRKQYDNIIERLNVIEASLEL